MRTGQGFLSLRSRARKNESNRLIGAKKAVRVKDGMGLWNGMWHAWLAEWHDDSEFDIMPND